MKTTTNKTAFLYILVCAALLAFPLLVGAQGNGTPNLPDTISLNNNPFSDDTLLVHDWNTVFSFEDERKFPVFLKFGKADHFIFVEFIYRNDAFIGRNLPVLEKSYDGIEYEPVKWFQHIKNSEFSSDGFSEKIKSENIYYRLSAPGGFSSSHILLERRETAELSLRIL